MVNSQSLATQISRLRDAVFDKKPVLRDILLRDGDKKLFDYFSNYPTSASHVPGDRQNEFLSSFEKELARLLGQKVAEDVTTQLRKYYFVSTADHHGPLNQSAGFAIFDALPADLNYFVILSCGNVSLNNSEFPRGLLFTSGISGVPQTQRFSFLPSNSHAAIISNFRPYTLVDINKIKKLMREKIRAREISLSEMDRITRLLDAVYSVDDVLQLKSFSEQVTVTNYRLADFFPVYPNGRFPRFIYVEVETLVTRLLLDYHIDSDTEINRILFSPEYEQLIYRYFEGIDLTFSREGGWGSYLFWAVRSSDNFRVGLVKEGGYLVSDKNDIRIALNPQSIREALAAGQLIPCSMLVYIVVSCYYGVNCLGFFSQVNYLRAMHEAYQNIQKTVGNTQNTQVSQATEKQLLFGDFAISFSRISAQDTRLTTTKGIDFIVHGTDESFKNLIYQAKHTTLSEAVLPLFPDFYRAIYPKNTDAQSVAITVDDLINSTNIGDRVTSLFLNN